MFDERREQSNRRKVDIFKYMIQFLEIYGNENFGQSAEVDWAAVWNFCSKCDMLDFNPEVEELVYNTTEEEFRDKVFSFLDKQAVEGYPLWRLFTMSKWLYDKCEEELIQNERKKDREHFYKTKCYRCKYLQCKVHVLFSTAFEPIVSETFSSIDEFKERYRNVTEVKTLNCDMTCLKREELLNEAYQKELRKPCSCYSGAFGERRFREEYRFKYSKFDYRDESQEDSGKEWDLIPSVLKRCNYFEESDMTPEKFEKLYYQIPRR